MSNYEYILYKLFLPIIGCFSDKYAVSSNMIIGEYSVYALAKQYGIFDNDLEKMLNFGIEPGISKDLAKKLKRETKLIL